MNWPKDMAFKELPVFDSVVAAKGESGQVVIQGVLYSRPSRNGRRVPVGNHPWNTGGKKGRSGGISYQLGELLAELRGSEDLRETLMRILKDPKSRNLPPLLKLMAQYDPDRPAERKETQGTHEIVVRFEREGRRITAG